MAIFSRLYSARHGRNDIYIVDIFITYQLEARNGDPRTRAANTYVALTPISRNFAKPRWTRSKFDALRAHATRESPKTVSTLRESSSRLFIAR